MNVFEGTFRPLSTAKAACFPLKQPNSFPPCPTTLHFRPLCSSKTSLISSPPKPHILLEFPSQSPPPCPLFPSAQFQEKLLYFDSLGVDFLSLLASHPHIASLSLSEAKTMVSFLHSVHLTTPDIRRAVSMCPEILTVPFSDLVAIFTFLLREVHVGVADLRHVIHRRPRLLTCSVKRHLRPTFYFLQGTIGISRVSRHTHLLSCSVESKFMPRIDYFQKLGFCYRDTICMFAKFPSLFCYSIEGNLEPKFNYFVVEMGRDLKELKEFPQFFSFSLENRIKVRHDYCAERGACLTLPEILKGSDLRFRERVEVCCGLSIPARTSPLWCARSGSDIT